jgi:hypothetical protein
LEFAVRFSNRRAVQANSHNRRVKKAASRFFSASAKSTWRRTYRNTTANRATPQGSSAIVPIVPGVRVFTRSLCFAN